MTGSISMEIPLGCFARIELEGLQQPRSGERNSTAVTRINRHIRIIYCINVSCREAFKWKFGVVCQKLL